MRRLWLAVIAAVLACTSASIAGDPPAIRQFDQETLASMGQYIYRQDQFAWKASDILSSQLTAEQAQKERLNGLWIAHLSPAGAVVRFLRDGDSGPEAAYDVLFIGKLGGVLHTPQSRTLDELELAQYRARKLALSSIPRPCSNRYNTVAMQEDDGNWLVWTLAATTVPDEVVYGGHYRFTISKDGTSVIQRDALSMACIRLPPPDPSQGKQVGAFVTQLVSKIPVETTVWLSLQHKTAFYVGTGENETWVVAEGTMSRVEH